MSVSLSQHMCLPAQEPNLACAPHSLCLFIARSPVGMTHTNRVPCRRLLSTPIMMSTTYIDLIEPAGGHRQGTKAPIFFGILPFGASPGECLTVGIARLKARNPSSPSSLSRAHPPISPRPAPARDSVFPRDASGLRRHTLRQRACRHRAPTLGPSSLGPPSLGPPSIGPPSIGPCRSVVAQTPIALRPPSRSGPHRSPPLALSLGPPSLRPPSLGPPSLGHPLRRPHCSDPPVARAPPIRPPLLGPRRSDSVAQTLPLGPCRSGLACAMLKADRAVADSKLTTTDAPGRRMVKLTIRRIDAGNTELPRHVSSTGGPVHLANLA